MSKVERAIAEHKTAPSLQLPGDFTHSIQQIGVLLQGSCSKGLLATSFYFLLVAINIQKIK